MMKTIPPKQVYIEKKVKQFYVVSKLHSKAKVSFQTDSS